MLAVLDGLESIHAPDSFIATSNRRISTWRADARGATRPILLDFGRLAAPRVRTS